ACVESAGSSASASDQSVRAPAMSPVASRFLASAERASSRCEWTSAWQRGQARAPGASGAPQIAQFAGPAVARLAEGKTESIGNGRANLPQVSDERDLPPRH